MLTPTRPLILGGNDSITLAPYHTHYPLLQQHMGRVGIASQPNLWNQPLAIGEYYVITLSLLTPVTHESQS